MFFLKSLRVICVDLLAPSAPTIIPEECSAENNSVTVAWQPPPQSHVEGYVLELDDGNGGDFRVSTASYLFFLGTYKKCANNFIIYIIIFTYR